MDTGLSAKKRELRWEFESQTHYKDCWKTHIDCALQRARKLIGEQVFFNEVFPSRSEQFLEGTKDAYTDE